MKAAVPGDLNEVALEDAPEPVLREPTDAIVAVPAGGSSRMRWAHGL